MVPCDSLCRLRHLSRAIVRMAFFTVCAGLSGCVHTQVIGQITHYAYEPWLPLLCAAATVGVLLLGLKLRRSKRLQALLLGWALITVSVVAGIPVSGSTAAASIVLSADGFSETHGLAGQPTRFAFERISAMRIESRRSNARNSRSRLVLEIQTTDEGFKSMVVSDLMQRAALVPMLSAAQAAGVRLVVDGEN